MSNQGTLYTGEKGEQVMPLEIQDLVYEMLMTFIFKFCKNIYIGVIKNRF